MVSKEKEQEDNNPFRLLQLLSRHNPQKEGNLLSRALQRKLGNPPDVQNRDPQEEGNPQKHQQKYPLKNQRREPNLNREEVNPPVVLNRNPRVPKKRVPKKRAPRNRNPRKEVE